MGRDAIEEFSSMPDKKVFTHLKIADYDYTDGAADYHSKLNAMDRFLADYLRILEELIEEEIIAGCKHSEKISGIVDYIKENMSRKLNNAVSQQATNMETYITDIDEADEILY
jgi:archaellum component FlaC